MNDENEISKNPKDSGLENYNPETHYIEKKTTYWKFVGFEFLVFICISSGAFISTYLGTNLFSNEKKLENLILLYTEFFSAESIALTILGIFSIVGLLTALNMMVTDSQLDLKSLFKRLIFSCIDFVYLMISTMLGFSCAALCFAMNQETSQDIIDLKKALSVLIITLIGLAIMYVPTFMVLPHQGKISDLKKKK
ncbi:hypothetical protein [Acinetobacter bereziniae]|uniref:hypothetical protein n=1 Tax=Acinetobacter bereziniae TaxID=106648 RepID=UPI001900130C|nr:hypothetical protein [Acinetobacter bereziniae]MBJ8445915.1 hypothetical protein [Acinetobacter bereziniae]